MKHLLPIRRLVGSLLIITSLTTSAQTWVRDLGLKRNFLKRTAPDVDDLGNSEARMSNVLDLHDPSVNLKPGDVIGLRVQGAVTFNSQSQALPFHAIAAFTTGTHIEQATGTAGGESRLDGARNRTVPLAARCHEIYGINTPFLAGAGSNDVATNVPFDFLIRHHASAPTVLVTVPPDARYLWVAVLDLVDAANNPVLTDNPDPARHWMGIYSNNSGSGQVVVTKNPTSVATIRLRAASYRGAEGAGGQITINRWGNTFTPARGILRLTDTGSAAAWRGSDFIAGDIPFFFPAGEGLLTIPLPPNDQTDDNRQPGSITADAAYENDETVTLSLHPDPCQPTHNISGSTTFTIVNDDPLPTLSFTEPALGVAEGTPNSANHADLSIPVRLSALSNLWSSFPMDVVGGSATPGEDFELLSSPSFRPGDAPGVWENECKIRIFHDEVDEPDETIILQIRANPTGGAVGAPATITLTIQDNDDAPSIVIESQSTIIPEQDATALPVTVRLDRPSAFEVHVPLLYSGTASGQIVTNTLFIDGPLGLKRRPLAPSEIDATQEELSFLARDFALSPEGWDLAPGERNSPRRLGPGMGWNSDDGSHVAMSFIGSPTSDNWGFELNQAALDRGADYRMMIFQTDALVGLPGHDIGEPVPFGVISGTFYDGTWRAPAPNWGSYGAGSTADPPDPSGSDYTAPNLVIIPAGQVSSTILVTTRDDDRSELDEQIVITLGDPTNATPGETDSLTLVIEDDDNDFPAPKPSGEGSITIDLDSPFGASIGFWRLAGDPVWRSAGNSATNLAPGYHKIEFRSLDGFAPPQTVTVLISEDEAFTTNVAYLAQGSTAPGTVQVFLEPTTVADPLQTPDLNSRIQWKLEGESSWRNSGETIAGVPAGVHHIFLKPVEGFLTPRTQQIVVASTATSAKTIQYFIDADAALPRPEVLAGAQTDSLPYAFNGQIRSDVGFSSGVAVGEKVVLTVAHALFDDMNLIHVPNVKWFHQKHRGYYEPSAENPEDWTLSTSNLVPRGWQAMSGYAAQREEDNSPGISSPASQDLDAAAMFFCAHAARGGEGTYLKSAQIPSEVLSSSVQKMLVGYPVVGIDDADRGKMFASSPANLSFFRPYAGTLDSVYRTADLRGYEGMSGGPLYVNSPTFGWQPAAIYLGGSAGTLVRVIDHSVEAIINLATEASTCDGNGTGSDGEYIPAFTADEFTAGFITVNMNIASGRWKRHGSSDWLSTGDALFLRDGELSIVEFADVPGWTTPAAIIVAAAANQSTAYSANYTSGGFTLWAASNFTAEELNDEAISGPLAASNGLTNLLSYAFGLDPGNAVHLSAEIATDIPGLPVIGVDRSSSPPQITIEFLERTSATAPGLQYMCEFAPNPAGPWASVPAPATKRVINADWIHTSIRYAPAATNSRAFVRVRVDLTE